MDFKIRLRNIFYNMFFWLALFCALYQILFIYAPDFSPKMKIIWAPLIMGFFAILFFALKCHKITINNDIKSEVSSFIDSKKNEVCSALNRKILPDIFLCGVFSLIIFKLCGLSFLISFVLGFIAALITKYITEKVSLKSIGRILSTQKEEIKHKIAFFNSHLFILTMGIHSIFLTLVYYFTRNYDELFAYSFGVCLVALLTFIKGQFGNSEVTVNKIIKNQNNNILCYSALLCCTISVSVYLGSVVLQVMGTFIPLILSSFIVFSSILGFSVCKIYKGKDPNKTFIILNAISCITYLILSYYLIKKVFLPEYDGIFETILTGIIFAEIFFIFLQKIKKETNQFLWLPVFLCGITMLFTFWIIGGMQNYSIGIYGVCLAAISMLEILTILFAYKNHNTFFYNETKNNSVDLLQIVSVATVSFLVLTSFELIINVEDIDILNPFVMFSVLGGSSLPLMFQSLIENAPSKIKKINSSFLLPAMYAMILIFLYGGFIAYYFGKILAAQSTGGIIAGMIISSLCLSVKNKKIDIMVLTISMMVLTFVGLFIS